MPSQKLGAFLTTGIQTCGEISQLEYLVCYENALMEREEFDDLMEIVHAHRETEKASTIQDSNAPPSKPSSKNKVATSTENDSTEEDCCDICLEAFQEPAIGLCPSLRKTLRICELDIDGYGESLPVPAFHTLFDKSHRHKLKVAVCGHRFCHSCTFQWVLGSNTCPMCRARLFPLSKQNYSAQEKEDMERKYDLAHFVVQSRYIRDKLLVDRTRSLRTQISAQITRQVSLPFNKLENPSIYRFRTVYLTNAVKYIDLHYHLQAGSGLECYSLRPKVYEACVNKYLEDSIDNIIAPKRLDKVHICNPLDGLDDVKPGVGLEDWDAEESDTDSEDDEAESIQPAANIEGGAVEERHERRPRWRIAWMVECLSEIGRVWNGNWR
ncbi:hypothetical protein BCR34DRAFT_606347 [Clohesyomyces aquaticus]|uniref:RING-type domain-containing protein n=1 Tax=Clohesyomyces aquaticus TaxID=1231657 RepID=A0A1Y1YQD6_9PLEO|nr:hypothetical protein BCR34DRAFT_606347 [Clohesyomyces aquaticus]